MALHTITPAERVLASFSSEDASRISSNALAGFSKIENDYHSLFHYEVSPYAKSRLTGRGLYLSPFPYETHSHAVCKTLESHLINVQLPSYIDESFIIVGIKDHKLNALRKRKNLRFLEAVNRCVTSHDIQRYPDCHFQAADDEWSHREKRLIEKFSPCVSSLLPKILKDKSEAMNAKIFLYDELHYWNLDDIVDFLEISKAQTVIGSFVFPTEIIIGCRESMNPWAYEFEIRGDKVLFAPDGVWSEAYEQPIAAGNILKVNKIHTKVGDYSVQVRGSTFCHCLVIINRDSLINEQFRTFSDFDATSIEKINIFGGHASDIIPVRSSTILSVFNYIRTLKKPDLQSGMAKHRQLVDGPTGFEVRFIEDFVQFLLNHHEKKNLLEQSLLNFLSDSFVESLPFCMQRFFHRMRSLTLGKFLEQLKPLKFTVECSSYSRGFKFSRIFLRPSEVVSNDPVVKTVALAYAGHKISHESYLSAIEEGVHCLFSDLHRDLVNRIGLLIIDRWIGLHGGGYYQAMLSLLNSIRFTGGQRWKDVGLPDQKLLILLDMCNSSLLKTFVRNVIRRRLNLRNSVRGLLECKVVSENPTDKRIASYLTRFNSVLKELVDLDFGGSYRTLLLKTPIGSMSQRAKVFSGACQGEKTKTFFTLSHDWKFQIVEPEVEIVAAPTLTPPHTNPKPQPEGEMVVEEPSDQESVKFDHLKDDLISFIHGLNFDLGYKHKGRSALFFSIGSFAYGFNNFVYSSRGWNDVLEKVSGGAYNSCLVQRYDENASIGFHSDDEPCYNDDVTVLTLNISGEAVLNFKMKDRKSEEELPSSLTPPPKQVNFNGFQAFLMPPLFQKFVKHSVSNCSQGRISMTFRNQVRDLNGVTIPRKVDEVDDNATFTEVMNGCHIGLAPKKYQCELSIFSVEGDGNCFWHAVSSIFGLGAMEIKSLVASRALEEGVLDLERVNEFKAQMMKGVYASDSAVTAFCKLFSMRLVIKCLNSKVQDWMMIEPVDADLEKISMGYLTLDMQSSHYNLAVPKQGCVVRAVSEFLKQNPVKVLSILSASCSKDLLNELNSGLGVQDYHLEEIFQLFNIKGLVANGDDVKVLNPEGSRAASFIVENGHFSYAPKFKSASNLESNVGGSRNSVIPNSIYSEFLRGFANEISFTPDFQRAKTLADSLLSGTTGVICSKNLNGQRDWLSDRNSLNFAQRTIGAIVGTFGSGKSHNVVDLVRKNIGYRNTVISPRRSLKDQLIENLGLNSARARGVKTNTDVVTFEVPLTNNKISLLKKTRIFIDELQLYPPGYLDLLCLVASTDSSFIIMGDPAQSCYDSDSDRLIFEGKEGNMDVLLGKRKYIYLSESERFRNPMYINRLPCSFNEKKLTMEIEEYAIFPSFKVLREDYLGKHVKTFLVSSLAEKNIVWAHLGKRCEVLTFGESTGMTFTTVCVLLTQDSMLSDERRWVVALSRARENIFFVNMSGLSANEFCIQMGNSVVSRFFAGKASLNDLRSLLPGEPVFSKRFSRLGADEVDRETRLSGDPWLKTKIFLGQRPTVSEEVLVEDERPPGVNMKVHCPTAGLGGHIAMVQSKMRAKEHREKRVDFELVTHQFTDEFNGKGEQIMNQAESFEAIYPRHRAGDTATFVMAARKRLHFSKPAKEKDKYLSAIPYGEMMLKVFLKHIKLKSSFDHRMLEESVAEFEVKKLEKSAATLENHSNRSDPDWPIEKTMIFMKSQLCTKFDNRFRDAKAGQTLACFQHNVLCRLAPYIRYMEKKVKAVLPKNLYIHSGKNFDELRDWVYENRFEGICTESDYEAFDSSQDCNILAFEVALMKHLQLPKDLIEDYKYLKFHTWSKLGDFSVMRFTGEAGTFLFNTLANMVFTFMRYSINGRESICFAGDDMCANANLRKTSAFEHVLDRMKLKAKVSKTTEPTFCGWRLGTFGIVKRPELVLEKLMLQREKGKLQDCLDNYAIEVSYAYNLGERLVSILSENELEAHYLCVRFFVQHKKYFKSSVLNIFQAVEGCTSPDRLFHGRYT